MEGINDPYSSFVNLRNYIAYHALAERLIFAGKQLEDDTFPPRRNEKKEDGDTKMEEETKTPSKDKKTAAATAGKVMLNSNKKQTNVLFGVK